MRDWRVAGGFILLFVLSGVGLCTAAWSTLLFLGELFLPAHTGVFVDAGRITGIGIMGSPVGEDVYGSGLGVISGLLAGSMLLGNVLFVWLGLGFLQRLESVSTRSSDSVG